MSSFASAWSVLRCPIFAAWVVCLLFLHCGWSQDSPREQYGAIAKATRLDAEGKAPFHLRIDADVYNLAGSAPQKATVEEWWVSPKQWRIELKGAGVDEVQSSAEQTPTATVDRAQYLLGEVLTQVVRPLTMPTQQQELEFKAVDRSVSGVKLHCLAVHVQHVGSADRLPPNYCLGPAQDLRLVGEGAEVVVRNRIGRFHNIDVGLQIAIGFNSKLAINGTVAVLEGFDPAKSRLSEFAVGTAPVEGRSQPVQQPPFIARGLKTGGQPAMYPEAAKREKIQGAVVLCALITTQGRIGSLDVVATSSDVLTRAAKDAVKTWTYTPFLADGKPVAIATTITVTFNIW